MNKGSRNVAFVLQVNRGTKVRRDWCLCATLSVKSALACTLERDVDRYTWNLSSRASRAVGSRAPSRSRSRRQCRFFGLPSTCSRGPRPGGVLRPGIARDSQSGWLFSLSEAGRGGGGGSRTHNYLGRLGTAVPVDPCCPGGGCWAPEMQISKTQNKNMSSYLSNLFFHIDCMLK